MASTESEEKELVEDYLAEHDLENVLNKIINRIVKHRPEDPFVVLSNLIKKESKGIQGILSVEASQCLDGRGFPTLRMKVTTSLGVFQASVPNVIPGIVDQLPASPVVESNASETQETPEEEHLNPDDASSQEPFIEYGGKSMKNALSEIALQAQLALEGLDPTDQDNLDAVLDRLMDKVGKNATLALSMACCKAGAKHLDRALFEHMAALADNPVENTSIPAPLVSLINGGEYASSLLFLRDILILPLDAPSFAEALRATAEVKHLLEQKLGETNDRGNVGLVGGIATPIQSPEEILQHVCDAITTYRCMQPKSPALGLIIDVSAKDFHVPQEPGDESGIHMYNVDRWGTSGKGSMKTSEDLLSMYESWERNYNVMTIIDPFSHHDLKSFGTYHNQKQQRSDESQPSIGGDASCKLQLVADQSDNSSSNGISSLTQENACNTVLLSPSSFTTISQGIKLVGEIRRSGMSLMWGTLPGSTASDSFFLDFAIALNFGQVKLGGLGDLSGTLNYNHLLELSTNLDVPYVTTDFRNK